MRVHKRGEHERGGEEREACAERIDDERDPERDAVPRPPAAEPVDDRRVETGYRQQAGEDGARRGGDDAERVVDARREPASHRGEERRGGDRDGDGERREAAHGR